jgi:ABC transport system ATP-binding/permease protein
VAEAQQLWIADDKTGRRRFLTGERPFYIGHLEKNDLALLDDMSIDDTQAMVDKIRGYWCITPLSESIATSLNGARIDQPTAFTPGDVIGFGSRSLSTGLSDPVPADRPTSQPTGMSGTYSRTSMMEQKIIGRDETADIRLDHPTVSRRHAALVIDGDTIRLKDLGSTNGTFLEGEPVGAQSVLVRNGQRVDIGPLAFLVAGNTLTPIVQKAGRPLLVTQNLTYIVADRKTGKDLKLLDEVSLSIDTGTFICIIGESGSGKSTLIRQLSGRVKAQNGSITVRGLDLGQHFDALKHDIAYVPQEDLLHQDLTLGEALTFTARLRLPVDQTAASVRKAVRDALEAVDLYERIDTKISDLSGGQKKRASLACELITRPSVLLLDEVTSGLDEATDREVMRLLKRLASEGVTILCVTHTLANIEDNVDNLLVMARGGVPAFFGPPAKAGSHFKTTRLGQIFDRLESGEWKRMGRSSGSQPPQGATGQHGKVSPAKSRGPLEVFRQIGILCTRNAKLKLADRRGLLLALVQALIIGGLLGVSFGDFGGGAQEVQSKISLLTLLGMSSLWIGCNSASQDIVGERIIIDRERDMGLSALAVVMAKFLVTGIYTIGQMVIVVALLALGAQELPGGVVQQFALTALGGCVGVAIGLAISAWCQTRDQANIVVPLALIPQLILAGTLVPALPEIGKAVSEYAISAYWITEGMQANFIHADGPVTTFDLSTSKPATLESKAWETALMALGLHALGYLLAALRGVATRR